MTGVLEGRTAIVTGASRGIGAAVTRLAAKRGWDVLVNYTRDAAAAEAVAIDVRADGQRALVVQADVGDEAQVMAMYAELDAAVASGHLAPLVGLVNNAGVVDLPARVDEMAGARLERMFRINVFGSFWCAREALKRMSRQHGHAGGDTVGHGIAQAIVQIEHHHIVRTYEVALFQEQRVGFHAGEIITGRPESRIVSEDQIGFCLGGLAKPLQGGLGHHCDAVHRLGGIAGRDMVHRLGAPCRAALRDDALDQLQGGEIAHGSPLVLISNTTSRPPTVA